MSLTASPTSAGARRTSVGPTARPASTTTTHAHLRSAAATLAGASSATVGALTVVGRLDAAESPVAIAALVDGLAAEFRLRHDLRFAAASFSVRFTRPT